MTLADQVAVFNQGQVVQSGTPKEIYERPQSAFVASFLGAANFFKGSVAGRSGDRLEISLGDADRIAISASQGQATGNFVELVVRPEKMTIAPAGAPADDPSGIGGTNQIVGKVVQVVFAGSSIIYRVEWRNEIVTVFQQNLGHPEMAEGAAVRISWLPEDTVSIGG